MSTDIQKRSLPGERLTQQIWLRALAKSGRLPMPTIGRVRALEALVAAWETEDEE